MTKRLWACLLAVVLLLGSAACSTAPSDVSDENSDAASDTVSENGEFDPSAEPDESIDASADNTTVPVSGGTTAKPDSSRGNSTATTTKSGPVQTLPPDANKNNLPAVKLSNKTVRLLTHNNSHDKYIPYAKEAYGVDLQVEIVAYSDVMMKFVSYRLSNDPPDLVINGFSPAANNAGYFMPLENQIPWKHALWNDDALYKGNMDLRWKGHLYQISTTFSHYGFVFFNKDMLDEAGLDYPSDLYKKGTWTWDTLLTYAKELTLDPQNTGKPTQFGFGLGEAELLLYTTGKHFIGTDSKGNAVNNLLSPEIARYMTFHDKLIKSGTVYSGTMSSREAFGIGQIAMEVGFFWYTSGYNKLIKNDSLGLAPLPKDPSADKYYTPMEGDGWSIAAGCKNPDGALAAINAIRWANTDSAIGEASLKERYQKGTWTPELEAMRKLNDAPSNVPMLWAAFNVQNYWAEIWERAKTGEPWPTVAQSVAPAVDYEIKKLYDAESED